MLGESEGNVCDKWQFGGCRTVNCGNGSAQHCVGSPWKYSALLVPWGRKERKGFNDILQEQQIHQRFKWTQREKQKPQEKLYILILVTDRLQHGIFQHTGFPGGLGVGVLLLFCLYLGNSNRIIIPGAICRGSRFPRVLLRDALGAMENTYKCMWDCREPTGQTPTTLQTPGGTENTFKSAPQVKFTLDGIGRWAVPLHHRTQNILSWKDPQGSLSPTFKHMCKAD